MELERFHTLDRGGPLMAAQVNGAMVAARIYGRVAWLGASAEQVTTMANESLDLAAAFLRELRKRNPETCELLAEYNGRPADEPMEAEQ